MSELVDPAGNQFQIPEEKPTEEAPVPREQLKEIPEDMEVGYLVGLKAGGEFVFEVVGKEPGLVQLMGLHQYATRRINLAADINQAYGPALLAEQHQVLAKQLQQITQLVQVLLNMATNQSKSSLISR
jgi:hypothetical protein